MVYLTPRLNILTRSIRSIGKKLVRDFSEIEKLQSSLKGTTQFAGRTLERLKKDIFSSLNDINPNYNFLFYKSEFINKNVTTTWVINPLDGFTNFIHSIPHFCISVAILEEKETTCSIIYDPIKDEIFLASKGKGSYLNDSRLRVSSRSKQNESIISISLDENKKNLVHKEEELINGFMTSRRTGSSDLDLCYVASGRNEVFYKNNSIENEFSAGTLIVKEAGGIVYEKEKNKKNMFFASNRLCQDIIKNFINKM